MILLIMWCFIVSLREDVQSRVHTPLTISAILTTCALISSTLSTSHVSKVPVTILTAAAPTGILPADGGAMWAGVTGLELPFGS